MSERKFSYMLESFQPSEGGMIYDAYPKRFDTVEAAADELNAINSANEWANPLNKWYGNNFDWTITAQELKP